MRAIRNEKNWLHGWFTVDTVESAGPLEESLRRYEQKRQVGYISLLRQRPERHFFAFDLPPGKFPLFSVPTAHADDLYGVYRLSRAAAEALPPDAEVENLAAGMRRVDEIDGEPFRRTHLTDYSAFCQPAFAVGESARLECLALFAPGGGAPRQRWGDVREILAAAVRGWPELLRHQETVEEWRKARRKQRKLEKEAADALADGAAD